nr:cullin-4-like [Ipomoea trifida]
MKKAKTQAVACSIDTNNNAVHFSSDPSLAANIEDPSLAADVPTSAATSGGVTANLSRKKATPPQPAKKLVIKLLKVTFVSNEDEMIGPWTDGHSYSAGCNPVSLVETAKLSSPLNSGKAPLYY